MPATIEFVKPREFAALTRVMRIRGVDVYVHWTVFLVALLILLNAGRKPVMTLTALLSFLTLLLLHECGHMIAAQRLRTHAREIRLYPIFGLCFFNPPWSRFDHCVIAWGGVLAQLVVAIPLVLYTTFFGFTRFEALNAVLGIFGGYSLVMAVFNLLPIGRLDGATAWFIVPEFFRRLRRKPAKKSPWSSR
jgi:Zn-dependent protease